MNRPVIVAAAVGLALLAGCGDPVEPSPPPTSEDALTTTSDAAAETEAAPTTEAPETEEPEAQGPPEMPEEATEQTEAGAEAFVEHYFDTLNEARASGKTQVLSELASDDCRSCDNFEGTAAQGDLEPLEYSIKDATLTGSLATIPVDVTEQGRSGTAYVKLDWDESWIVASVEAGQ